MAMPKVTGIAQIYDGVADMRKEGHTLQEIGAHCGVSRETIRQVLAKYYPNLKPVVLNETEAAKLLGISTYMLSCLRQRSLISPIPHGRCGQYYDLALIVKAGDLIFKPCRLCGKKVKRVYCPKCGKKVRRNQYLVMSPEEKEKFRGRCVNWRQRHPERYKVSQARARATFRAKRIAKTGKLIGVEDTHGNPIKVIIKEAPGNDDSHSASSSGTGPSVG